MATACSDTITRLGCTHMLHLFEDQGRIKSTEVIRWLTASIYIKTAIINEKLGSSRHHS